MTAKFPEAEKRLRKSLLYYILSGVLLMIFLSGAIIMKKYTESLYATFDRLQDFTIQYIKVRQAIGELERSTQTMKAVLPREFSEHSVKEHMLLALDEVKRRVGSGELTIANIEDKGPDLQLPVTIKAPLRDYADLANFVGYLQSLKFPFFVIANLRIWRSEDSPGAETSWEIKGVLKLPKPAPGQGGPAGVPGDKS